MQAADAGQAKNTGARFGPLLDRTDRNVQAYQTVQLEPGSGTQTPANTRWRALCCWEASPHFAANRGEG
jgi:hypothetical protein